MAANLDGAILSILYRDLQQDTRSGFPVKATLTTRDMVHTRYTAA